MCTNTCSLQPSDRTATIAHADRLLGDWSNGYDGGLQNRRLGFDSLVPRLIQAVIFDLDGLLLDSESAWDGGRRALVAEHGLRVAGRRDGGDARHERARVVAPRPRGARRPARAAGDLRPRRRARAALLRRGAAAAARRRSGRGADRRALAARARVLLQQGGHRARDGDLGLGRRLPRLGLERGGRPGQARARRLPGGRAADRRRARRTPPASRTPTTGSWPRTPRGCGRSRSPTTSSRPARMRSPRRTSSSAGSTSSPRASSPATDGARPAAGWAGSRLPPSRSPVSSCAAARRGRASRGSASPPDTHARSIWENE